MPREQVTMMDCRPPPTAVATADHPRCQHQVIHTGTLQTQTDRVKCAQR